MATIDLQIDEESALLIVNGEWYVPLKKFYTEEEVAESQIRDWLNLKWGSDDFADQRDLTRYVKEFDIDWDALYTDAHEWYRRNQ